MKVVHTAQFHCKYCDKEISTRVFGNQEFDQTTKYYIEEAKKWAEHYHWTDHHRRCAICGNLVDSGNLGLIKRENISIIHEKYLKETFEVKNQLLVVHKNCIEKY